MRTVPHPPNDVPEENLGVASDVKSSGRNKKQQKSMNLKTCTYSNFRWSLGENHGMHRSWWYNNALVTSTKLPLIVDGFYLLVLRIWLKHACISTPYHTHLMMSLAWISGPVQAPQTWYSLTLEGSQDVLAVHLLFQVPFQKYLCPCENEILRCFLENLAFKRPLWDITLRESWQKGGQGTQSSIKLIKEKPSMIQNSRLQK